MGRNNTSLSNKNENFLKEIEYIFKAHKENWLIVRDPDRIEFKELALKLSKTLGRGEAYAIALSLEIKADLLLINDREAKEIAESRGIKTKWNVEILLEAYSKKIIKSISEVKLMLNNMIEQGLWIKRSKYNEILRELDSINKSK